MSDIKTDILLKDLRRVENYCVQEQRYPQASAVRDVRKRLEQGGYDVKKKKVDRQKVKSGKSDIRVKVDIQGEDKGAVEFFSDVCGGIFDSRKDFKKKQRIKRIRKFLMFWKK
jgi:hypothetical protein